MFYLNFLKDKYKVAYIWGTPKSENHYTWGTSNHRPKKHSPNT